MASVKKGGSCKGATHFGAGMRGRRTSRKGSASASVKEGGSDNNGLYTSGMVRDTVEWVTYTSKLVLYTAGRVLGTSSEWGLDSGGRRSAGTTHTH
jgi:hypothetical protein